MTTERVLKTLTWCAVSALVAIGGVLIAIDAPEVGDGTIVGTVMLVWSSVIGASTVIFCEIRRSAARAYKAGLEDGRRIGAVVDMQMHR